jgi:hypothetical protein
MLFTKHLLSSILIGIAGGGFLGNIVVFLLGPMIYKDVVSTVSKHYKVREKEMKQEALNKIDEHLLK